MKLLLIGANGQLGTDMNRIFQDAGDTVFPYVHSDGRGCGGGTCSQFIALQAPL